MKQLTKEEMKRIMGGEMAPPPGGPCANGQFWLVCSTPNGTEQWCRNSDSGNASDACEAIYPAYGDQVSGNWAPVISVS